MTPALNLPLAIRVARLRVFRKMVVDKIQPVVLTTPRELPVIITLTASVLRLPGATPSNLRVGGSGLGRVMAAALCM